MLVGDSMVEIQPRAAGARMCVARYGFGGLRGEPGLDDVDCAIDEPRDLLSVVRDLGLGPWAQGP